VPSMCEQWNQEVLRVRSYDGGSSLVRSFPSAVGVRAFAPQCTCPPAHLPTPFLPSTFLPLPSFTNTHPHSHANKVSVKKGGREGVGGKRKKETRKTKLRI
jgi:hypothetical protein